LYQRSAHGPAPALGATLIANAVGTEFDWSLSAALPDVTYTVRLSRDGGKTWQVLGLDQPQPGVTLPSAAANGDQVEVQATDGVRIGLRTYTIP
jgi:hypothetical protein